ncbi:MAG: hypothetical protein H0X65_18065, partial [Gemmatimonadetes bacterium]|nr:hypothetical protein [Gemmatimonadota bacterium]
MKRSRRFGHSVLGFVLPLVLLGCGSDANPRAGGELSGPTLVPLDSILLPESDTLYLGDPFTPAIDPYDGSIYISDQFSKRVVRFDRHGEVVRAYGRPGAGPGELQGSGLAFVLDDSTLVVEDWAVQRLNLFDRNSG